ncbi:thioredoxin family protein [Pelagicoccus mobilis]|uniref:Thioredoxin family protein n=1 Tax=Pelagicoccus mobilis TaxID=415221 RepID=A0A934S307_9BACT|nr:thioredoxin family protein [Pelagicoccus mobilis]MBK1878118.1 thioredoxin family protein [Pelagicoccus mobilis]
MSESKRTPWLKYALFAAAIAAAYFINVEVQTRLGENVLEKMPLERHSLDQAFAKAKAEKKLVLADLSAIWCPSCRSLDKHVLSNATVQKAIEQKYVFARIEYESPEGEAFMERYNTRAFPTLLILSPEGEKVRELPFTTEPSEFLPLL